MSEDMSELISKVKNMVDSGNIPDNIKDMMGSLNATSNKNNQNIDIDTILKMKSIIEKINQKDDPRANLLYSLKPYLRKSRQDKLDQYVNLLNMTKVIDIISNENKENSNGAK